MDIKLESNFLKIFEERGYFHQATHKKELDDLIKKEEGSGKGITAYIGFDCTAKSLHVGSLIQIMILRQLQKCGHNPIVLLGGGTTKIGDPSGKDEARQILTDEIIAENIAGIKKTLEKFDLSKTDSSLKPFQFVNNEDWLKDLKYIDFLRDFGRHFSVNRMLTFESVKMRLDRQQSLSFLEFNYMILQAYDFYKLNAEKNCVLQIGGSDQWGNIVNGVELTRRIGVETMIKATKQVIKKIHNDFPHEPNLEELLKAHSKLYDDFDDHSWNATLFKTTAEKGQKSISNIKNPSCEKRVAEEFKILGKLISESSAKVFGLTTPLLTTASGAKMGKTANGAVWLDGGMLDPFEYFQYFRNVDDKDVPRFLRLFTELDSHKIAEIEQKDINEQKKILASEATEICHGLEIAKQCEEKAEKIFGNKDGDNIDDLPQIELQLTSEEMQNGKMLAAILKEQQLCESFGEAKRLIKGGGVKINEEKIIDESYMLKFNNETSYFKLSLGKKKFFKVNFSVK